MRSRDARSLITLVAALSVLDGCDGVGPAQPACPNDTPATCPSPAPGFAADVFPIFQQMCAGCHVPGGMEPTRPYQTYEQIAQQKVDIDFSITSCLMPPVDKPQLTLQQRHAILAWIVCGAPDN